MSNLYKFLKSKSLNVLPESVIGRMKKIHYRRVLSKFSKNEEPDIKIIEQLISQGDYIIDIGANIGVYTKIFSEMVGRGGKVFSFEPIPQTFYLTQHNLLLLH